MHNLPNRASAGNLFTSLTLPASLLHKLIAASTANVVGSGFLYQVHNDHIEHQQMCSIAAWQ